MNSTPATISTQLFLKDKRKLSIFTIITILVVISWSEVLDTMSFKYLDDTFVSAISSYAASRGLNMAISVVETTTVSIGVASVSIGEALDPLNDVVERFSELITLSIGSIVVQKILLSIVSSLFFKVSLTISAILLIISIYSTGLPYLKPLSQLFVFLMFLRISLSLMMLLNYTVDQSFLNDQIEHSKNQVDIFSEKLSKISSGEKEKEKEVNRLQEEITLLNNEIPPLNRRLTPLLSEQALLHNKVASLELDLDKYSTLDRYNPFNDDESLNDMNSELSQLQQQLDRVDSQINTFQNQIDDINTKATYKKNIISGESNGFFDDMGNEISGLASSFRNVKVTDLLDKSEEYIGNILDLMILYIMKTLILPILFMYLLTKAFKLIWEIELFSFINREYKSIK